MLVELDGELAALVDRRRGLVARIEACNLAIAGTGRLPGRPGEKLLLFRRRPRVQLRDAMPEVLPARPERDQATDTALTGRSLREAVEQLLSGVDQPLTLPEVERILRWQGHLIPGRPSQTIVNALRPALRDGSIARVGRGRYAAGRRS